MPGPVRRSPACTAMIVAPQPEAVESGLSMLEAGGSAIDAVIACALVQGVVDPLMCGIGGLWSLQLYYTASGRHAGLGGLSPRPSACPPGMWGGGFARRSPDG